MHTAKVRAYMVAALARLGAATEEVNEAIKLIGQAFKNGADPLPFRLLAARRYLRIDRTELHGIWSWTAEQARAEQAREPTKTLYKEAREVCAGFEQVNPGYKLIVSPLRDMQKQVVLWNKNPTVGPAGAKLLKETAEFLARPNYPDEPTGDALARFSSYLRQAKVSPEPTSAAPGTSNHGRGTAVDFVVQTSSGAPVAGTNTVEIEPKWKKGGWEKKLIAACAKSKLKGPLPNPYEPWHWELK